MSEDAALEAVDRFIESQGIDTSSGRWKTSLPAPEPVAFSAGKTYHWNLETSVGAIRVKLLPDVAPMHVTSTIYLTRLGFYDGTAFHRVIPDFMAQGGDPLGNGTGGPGYEYDGEFDASVRHDRPGLLSMANRGPGTDGSQFFLTFVATPWLDDKHSIFGEVVEGLDTLKALEAHGSESGRTREALEITRATITVD
jgi:cyclophilin family peptidyl-prolyl cis-trans isomerase